MSSGMDKAKGPTHWTCPYCSFEHNPIDRDICWSCKKRRPAAGTVGAQTGFDSGYAGKNTGEAIPANIVQPQIQTAGVSRKSQASLPTRYRDAYIQAKVTVGWGKIVKGIAIAVAVFGILAFFVGLSTGKDEGKAYFGLSFMIFCFAALIYIGGILIAAQGQMLYALLDSAVNSFPSLTEEERARMMSL